MKQIPFFIRQIATVKDDLIGQYHLFLVPTETSEAFIKLHDVLYTGILAAQLRRYIAFIPHITIGNRLDSETSRDLVGKLKNLDLNIKGIVDFLEVASFKEKKIHTLERIQLEK
jgi:2'-5' RNA ligase